MDRVQAKNLFESEIIGRWRDMNLAGVLLEDWFRLMVKFEPDDFKAAVAQYVMNYDSYKKPSLNKIKDILNARSRFNSGSGKAKPDEYPKFFLQCDCIDANVWKYGTFTQIIPEANNYDSAMRIMDFWQKEFGRLYCGIFKIIVCNNRSEWSQLVKDRTQKKESVKNFVGINLLPTITCSNIPATILKASSTISAGTGVPFVGDPADGVVEPIKIEPIKFDPEHDSIPF